MADELEMVTQSADGDSWVDQAPAAVSTGYQAQNTSAESARAGMDSSLINKESINSVRVEISGPIDDNGVLFTVKTPKILSIPSCGSKWAVCLKPGTVASKRSLELVDYVAISYSAQRNCYLTGTENYRVLNWVIECEGAKINLYRLAPPGCDGFFGDTAAPPYGYVRYQDVAPWLYRNCPIKTHELSHAKPADEGGGPISLPGTGAMTFIDNTHIAYIRSVSVTATNHHTYGYSVLDLATGQRTDDPQEFSNLISSMYYNVGTGELIACSGGHIRIYTGSRPSGSYRLLTMDVVDYDYGYAFIDVVDGDLVAMSLIGRTNIFRVQRFDGISNHAKQTFLKTNYDRRELYPMGLSHLGDRMFLGLWGKADHLLHLHFWEGDEFAKVPSGYGSWLQGDLRTSGGILAFAYRVGNSLFINTINPF